MCIPKDALGWAISSCGDNQHAQGIVQIYQTTLRNRVQPSNITCFAEKVLSELDNTSLIMDEVLLSGRMDDEHLNNLEEVLQRFQSYGLCVSAECYGTASLAWTSMLSLFHTYYQDFTVWMNYSVARQGENGCTNKIVNGTLIMLMTLFQVKVQFAHYDPGKPAELVTDASLYVVAALLMQNSRPVAYVSRS